MTKARDVSGTPEVVLSSATFTTAATLSVSNVLSDTYKFYRIYLYAIGSTNAQDLNFRFRENTTDKTSGYYAGGVYASYAGTVASFGAKNNGGEIRLSTLENTFDSVSTINLYRKNATEGNITCESFNRPQAFFTNTGGWVGSMTNFNGFTLFPSAGTMTGYYILTGKRV